jgi:HD-GYP domain-containing protein (c-di-GMP phosphodiesterase class II)
MLLDTTVEALAGALGLRDGSTGEHSAWVVELACRLGQRLGLSDAELRELEYAARLHDIGKLGVPDSILHKPAPLSPREWKHVRGHAAWGAQLLARVQGLESVARIVRHHHERYDGTGYPDGLAGEEIPFASRILAVADSYVAMTEDRRYRQALPRPAAVRELRRNRGTQFDPHAVDALLELLFGARPRAVSATAGTSA